MSEPVTLTISNDGKQLRVTSWNDLVDWLSAEKAKWDWLLNLTDTPNNVSRIFIDNWNNMINDCSNRRNRGEDYRHGQNPLTALTNGNVLYSGSQDGALVFDILQSAGDREAAAAAALLVRHANLSHANDARSVRGMLLVALPDMQKASDLEGRLRRERANYRDSLKRSIEEAAHANEVRATQFASTLLRARRIGVGLLRKQRERDAERIRHVATEFNEARSSIREVENTYKEYMKLRAPVEYWDTKATEHKNNRIAAFKNLRSYFVVMAIVLTALFAGAGTLIYKISQGETTNPLSLYLVISGGLAALSTIAFWFGRLLTKLYLSEHHLQTDAEERAVMARTFLALINDGAANETDKDIILAALFRATQDGIINDDGPPDLAFQTLAARLLTGKSSV
ncbi:MAG: DUF6161 domain-containing protein [Erythrobacter sp.]